MKLPRDLSGRSFAKTLSSLGYEVTRETGSHMRLTTRKKSEHSITIPNHDYLKVGILSAILRDIANHFNITKKELLKQLNL